VHNNDYLKIYDSQGVSEDALLAQISGNDLPADFEATNENGALTFVFRSMTNSPTKSGWHAIIYEQQIYHNVLFVVTDEDENPVTGANIVFDGYLLAKNQFDVPLVQQGEYNCSVTGKYYNDYFGTVAVEDEDVTEYITLQFKNETYNVTFNIIDDQTEEPILDATIVFDGELLDSYFVENLKPRTYQYSVSKDGYITVNQTITIDDKNEEIEVRLKDYNAIKDVEFANVILYPNPFSDVINLKCESSLVKKVIIENILGQKIKEIYLDGKTSFSTQNLPKGVYFITLERYDNESKTIKMVKK